MSRTTCDDVRLALSDLLAGDEPGAVDVVSHLWACAACRAHAEEVAWQDRALAELAAQSRVEATVSRIRESIRGAEQVSGPAEIRRRRSWAPWAVAAAALVVSAVGLWKLWPKPPEPDREQASEPVRRPIPRPEEAPKDPEPPKVTVKDLDEPRPREDRPVVAPKPPDVKEEKTVTVPPTPPPTEPQELVKKHVVAPGEARVAPVQPPPAPPKPIELGKRSLDEAVRVGTAYLRERAKGLGGAGGGGGRDQRVDELVLWTFIHAGVPETDPEFQRLFKGMLERKLESTYRVAFQAMILEELDRVKYQGRIHQCAQFLVDNQCRNGQWSYGDPSMFAEELATVAAKRDVAAGTAAVKVKSFEPPPVGSRPKPKVVARILVRKLREGPESGDNSNSMYAALGLRACFDAGVVPPAEVVQLAAKAWRDAQNRSVKPYDGWCYGPKGHGHKGYGSMTAGAVGSLAIYDYIRDGDPEGRRGSWKKDVDILSGLDWLARNWSVTSNPGTPEHGEGRPDFAYYYYMYALERAAILYGTDKIGPHDWYARGSEALLERQRLDGAWTGSGGDLSDTCFAILFLRRATTALVDVATGSPRKK